MKIKKDCTHPFTIVYETDDGMSVIVCDDCGYKEVKENIFQDS